MSDRFDVIVVGVGAMGSSACYQLAQRGARVLGLERFDIPHEHGSSHGFSRMFRVAYFEHPDYVTLLRRAFDLWQQLEAESGQQLLYVTGGLYLGLAESELVSGSRSAAEAHGIAYEMLDRRQLNTRYPQFQLPDEFVAFYEPKAGFLHPEHVIAAQAVQALRRGAQLHGREPVIDWQTDTTGVTVRTERATYTADKLVFCGGAWSEVLLKRLGVPLRVTRQVLGWVWPRRPELFELGAFPCWALDLHAPQDFAGIHYGFPMMADNPGFKIALHWPMSLTDPDAVVRDVLPDDEPTFRPVLHEMLPDADGPLLALRTCLYTNTADGHFIIDRHPDRTCRDRVLIACGFSGHGFKFASVVGEILADLATSGASSWPIEFLGLSRFGA